MAWVAKDDCPKNRPLMTSPLRERGEDSSVGGLDGRDVVADSLHHAGALVTEDGGQGRRVVLVAHGEVGMADARADDAHEHLVRLRVLQRHRLNVKVASFLIDNCSLDFHEVGDGRFR